jgi:hypothetical protein
MVGKGTLRTLAAAASCALVLAAGTAQAQTPVFRSIGGIFSSDGTFEGFRAPVEDVLFSDTPTPNSFDRVYTRTHTGSGGNSVQRSQVAARYNGFYSSGTLVDGTVTNAYKPADEGDRDGYYSIAGMGSWTQHRFVSPADLTGAWATFSWHVTGTFTKNIGWGGSRLDFRATNGAESFNDLYNDTLAGGRLTQFGPGSYNYSTFGSGADLSQVIDFMFWGSSFWQVEDTDMNALAGPGTIYGKADFFRTFQLDDIKLFNEDGEITDWSLENLDGSVEWDSRNGRINPLNPVPEPGSVALLIGAALAGGLVVRRRRS